MATEAATAKGPFLVVNNLSKRFGPDWALARASFSLDKGMMGVLTGANGSGKTTLLRCLETALVPDFGQALVGGNDLLAGRDEVRRRVASLRQPLGAYGGLSARENLALASQVLNVGGMGSIDSVLDRVGLRTRQDAPLDAFSSGMKQRFALARLSFLGRELILLDEPETHLDSSGFGLLREMIAEWKTRGAVVVCATHAVERFHPLFDLEVRLVHGRAEPPKRGA